MSNRLNVEPFVPERLRTAYQKSGCGHFFEKEEHRLRAARIRLVAMLPAGGFVRRFLAEGEKDPPRRETRRIRMKSEGLRFLRHHPREF